MGGIAIKTDTSKIELTKIVKDLFGNEFEKIAGFCDSRKKDCVYVGKTKDFLIIVNADFAGRFFVDQSAEKIQTYLHYFSKPEFVFAFEEYDSGGSYGYSLIYNGNVKRQFRSLSYETTIDFGELEQSELKWKNAETTKEDQGNGEFDIVYKHPEKDASCYEEQLPKVILQELMREKLGFVSWNMDEFIIEQGSFKKNATPKTVAPVNKPQPVATPANKKPWWKIW